MCFNLNYKTIRKNKIPFCAKMYWSFAFLFHFCLMTSLVNGKWISKRFLNLPTSFNRMVEYLDESNVWISRNFSVKLYGRSLSVSKLSSVKVGHKDLPNFLMKWVA